MIPSAATSALQGLYLTFLELAEPGVPDSEVRPPPGGTFLDVAALSIPPTIVNGVFFHRVTEVYRGLHTSHLRW